MARVAAALALGLSVLACGGATGAGEEDSMRFVVNESADLGLPLSKAVAEAVARADGQLEVVLEAGSYDRDLVIRDPAKPPRLRLTVTGRGGPAVFSGARIDLRAREIVLEGVEVRGWRGDETPVVLAAGSSALLRRAVFADLVVEQSGLPVVLIEGIRKSGETTVTIEDSWFLDNAAERRLILVDSDTRDPTRGLRLVRTGFARNNVPILIFGYALGALELHQSVAVEPFAASLLWCAWDQNTVTLDESAVLLGGEGPWLRRDANPPVQAAFAEPVLNESQARTSAFGVAELAGAAGSAPELVGLRQQALGR